MAYKVIILYQLYMPSYFLGTFTEYPGLVSLRSGSVSPFRLASLGLWLVISIRNVVSSTGIEDVPICTALIGHLRLR